MTRVLSTIASPAKRTRTLLWLSSQRNGSSGLNEGVAIGPRNISSSTGCLIVIPLLPELKNALHGSRFSSDMPRPVPFQTPVLLLWPSLSGISSRQEREEGGKQEAQPVLNQAERCSSWLAMISSASRNTSRKIVFARLMRTFQASARPSGSNWHRYCSNFSCWIG